MTVAYVKKTVPKLHYEKRCRGSLPNGRKCPCTLLYSAVDLVMRPGTIAPTERYGDVGHYAITCPNCCNDQPMTRWEVYRAVDVLAVAMPDASLHNIGLPVLDRMQIRGRFL